MVALEISPEHLPIYASLGVCTFPIVEKIGFEIRPSEAGVLSYE